MRLRLFAALLLMCSVGVAQVVEQQMQMQMARPGQGDDPAKPKPSAEQLQRGRQMLEQAEASANGMEGGMRAYALLQVANAYAPSDKKKALQLLDDALAATKGMDDEMTRNRLQEQILQAIVPLKPEKADELLNQVDPSARGRVLNSLLGYYQKNKDWNRALEVVYRIAAEQEVPYDAVGRIMTALPEEQAGDKAQLFSTALTSYKNHPPTQGRRGGFTVGGDFSSLILSSWKQLPRETVLDAIHAVLDRTRQEGQNSGGGPQPMSVSMMSAAGGVQFNSMYEFRLFQLLPVLKQIDSSEAEKLVKESEAVKGMLEKYPEGLNPTGPGGGTDRQSNNMMSMSFGGGGGGGRGGPGGSGGPNPMLMQQMMKIIQDAAKHPEEALANAGALPDKSVRASAFMGIAQTTAKSSPSTARQALEKAVDGIAEQEVMQQVQTVSSAARLYLELDDAASAKKLIEKGLGIAEKAYKQDTNADDPNKALKAYWPSAEAYRGMLRLAARISPTWAMELLKDISDPDMKGVAQIALAQAWLDLPAGGSTIMRSNKSGTSMSQSVSRD